MISGVAPTLATNSQIYATKVLQNGKIKERGFVVSKFVRDAIKEKVNREQQDLKPKKKKDYCPF